MNIPDILLKGQAVNIDASGKSWKIKEITARQFGGIGLFAAHPVLLQFRENVITFRSGTHGTERVLVNWSVIGTQHLEGFGKKCV